VVLVGAVHDGDELDAGVRASFTHELDVALPTQDDRETLIRQFGSDLEVFRHEVEPDEKGGEAAEVGVRDARERSEGSESKWLATRTAGSSPADLSALLSRAAAIALARTLKEDSHGDGGGGVKGEGGVGRVLGGGTRCKVSREDVSKALHTVQAQTASAIGAPKVPNVKWDDVGGLEEVECKILEPFSSRYCIYM
jgi:peroxin-6